MGMLIRLTVVIISQHIHVSKLHLGHCKYVQFLLVNNNLIKLEILKRITHTQNTPFKKQQRKK